jgi:hypothetical protein
VNSIDPHGLKGFAIEAGGSYATGDGSSRYSDSGYAASGLYFGGRNPNKPNEGGGYAEIGAFSYTAESRTAGAHLGLGISFTHYKIDADNFFKGKLGFKMYAIPLGSLTKYYDLNGKYVGWTINFGPFGRGMGLSISEGCSEGYSAPLQ